MPVMQPSAEKPCALFWDESFLWGLMARQALAAVKLPFELLRSGDIRAGELSRYAMLFVPGGWAAAKVRALGKKGEAEICRFVENGGSYLGICGGAGLATQSHLGLLPVDRTPNSGRVPSFSGPISLSLADSPVWKNISTPVFSAWWPPELDAAQAADLRILARYHEAQPEAYSADIRVEDGRRTGWTELEKQYGILLDPARLKGKPAVVEGRYGKGKVILSLVHFDTPGDLSGAQVLQNLWNCLIKDTNRDRQSKPLSNNDQTADRNNQIFKDVLHDIQNTVDTVMAEGKRLLLWQRRNDLLLQWRRGVRGMEFSTLDAMTGELVMAIQSHSQNDGRPDAPSLLPCFEQWTNHLKGIKTLLLPFVDDAIKLVRLEHRRLVDTSSRPMDFSEEELNRLRRNLFGSARHFGGRFKPLIEAIDRLLYILLKSA